MINQRTPTAEETPTMRPAQGTGPVGRRRGGTGPRCAHRRSLLGRRRPLVDHLAADGLPAGALTVEVHRVSAAAVRPLRLAVLRPGSEPADVVWAPAGDGDPGTVHFAAQADNGAVVA